MKKLYFLLSTTAALLSISFSAYAGQWQQEGEHWKYLNNDGTYSAHTWQWIEEMVMVSQNLITLMITVFFTWIQ